MGYHGMRFFLTKPFLFLAILGGAGLLFALTDILGQVPLEAREKAGLGLLGLGLLLGGGCKEALSYDPAEGDILPLRILSRIGFSFIGPGAVLLDMESLLRDFGWPICLLGCGVTVVPFGISLAILLIRKTKGTD